MPENKNSKYLINRQPYIIRIQVRHIIRFAAMLADGITISCSSYQLQFRLDVQFSAFVVNFIISFSIGCGSGLDIIKYQHSSKPSTLCRKLLAHFLPGTVRVRFAGVIFSFPLSTPNLTLSTQRPKRKSNGKNAAFAQHGICARLPHFYC